MPIILFHIIPILSPGASMQEGLYLSLEKEEEEGEGEIRVRPILPFPLPSPVPGATKTTEETSWEGGGILRIIKRRERRSKVIISSTNTLGYSCQSRGLTHTVLLVYN
jgi:hypothetical protein